MVLPKIIKLVFKNKSKGFKYYQITIDNLTDTKINGEEFINGISYSFFTLDDISFMFKLSITELTNLIK